MEVEPPRAGTGASSGVQPGRRRQIDEQLDYEKERERLYMYYCAHQDQPFEKDTLAWNAWKRFEADVWAVAEQTFIKKKGKRVKCTAGDLLSQLRRRYTAKTKQRQEKIKHMKQELPKLQSQVVRIQDDYRCLTKALHWEAARRQIEQQQCRMLEGKLRALANLIEHDPTLSRRVPAASLRLPRRPRVEIELALRTEITKYMQTKKRWGKLQHLVKGPSSPFSRKRRKR